MKTYAFVFARGGSKGIINKNIKKLHGKPLLSYSIDLAKQIKSIDKVFVSTDNNIISKIAYNNGAEVINRPKELADDDTPEWLAWQHAVEILDKKSEEFDVFLSLPTTSPLRNEKDVNLALSSLDDLTDIVVSMTVASRNPWFNMVEKTKNGLLKIPMQTNQKISRRQDAPMIYDLSTVAYVTRPNYIKNANGIFDGKVKGIEIPPERSIDIDTDLDFKIAEFLMSIPS